MTKHLLTLYTRTPLHVGCGTSVDVVDLPIMRERITGFPVIPGSSLKGVLLQAAREHFDGGTHARSNDSLPEEARILFGSIEKVGGEHSSNAGCVQIMEAKLLAFPVRSLAGCFAWITCPAVLERFQRDTGASFVVPSLLKDQAAVAAQSELIIQGQDTIVLEEYAISAVKPAGHGEVADALTGLVSDSLWTGKLVTRLAIIHDEDFQHFVSTCTEVVARIVMNPATRTNGNLFNQENIPCEALFYSVLNVLVSRRKDGISDPQALLKSLLSANPVLQIGGDETTGHGFCEASCHDLPIQLND